MATTDRAGAEDRTAGRQARAPQPPAKAKKKVSLYAEYQKVYPRRIRGTFRSLKTAAAVLLLGFYFVAPFLRWGRGPGAPDQAILIDMPGRRAYFFSIEIWPQEVYYLTGLLILAAVGLFFVTALFGRIWCGFACWQTVWTDWFLGVERWFEGDRNERRRLDGSAWSGPKLARKLGKWATWFVISLATGIAFTLYFGDAYETLAAIFTGRAGVATYSFIAIIGGSAFVLAGWAREQVCIYMCPWPRLQGAMFDEDSYIVSYESWRGEPRAPARPGQSFEGRGHCVDCRMCVQVCPTGIDIREGTQLACIGCALCIDACNGVMDRFGLPRGLIRYDSERNIGARSQGRETRFTAVRPRTIIYAVVLLLVGAIMLYSLLNRSTTELSVLHDRAPLWVAMSDGSIRNGYTVKLLNMVREPRSFDLRVEGVEGAELAAVGVDGGGDSLALPVDPDTVGTYRVFVTAPPEAVAGERIDMWFAITDAASGETRRVENVFAGPAR